MQGRWGRARIELIIGFALVGAAIAVYMIAKHYRWIGLVPIGLIIGLPLAAMGFLYADAMEDRERKRRHRRRKP